jgi:hypothetical protein
MLVHAEVLEFFGFADEGTRQILDTLAREVKHC